MDILENDLVNCTVILQMLENLKHKWTNEFARSRNTGSEELDRITLILDSIELEIARQQEQIKYIGNYVIHPTN